jgi:hypothetical protein
MYSHLYRCDSCPCLSMLIGLRRLFLLVCICVQRMRIRPLVEYSVLSVLLSYIFYTYIYHSSWLSDRICVTFLNDFNSFLSFRIFIHGSYIYDFNSFLKGLQHEIFVYLKYPISTDSYCIAGRCWKFFEANTVLFCLSHFHLCL